MDDLRVVAVARLEAALAEYLEHGGVLGKDLGRQFFQAGRTGEADQMPCQHRANPLSLISIDHDKSDFSLAWFGHDVAAAADDLMGIAVDRGDQRDLIDEVDMEAIGFLLL